MVRFCSSFLFCSTGNGNQGLVHALQVSSLEPHSHFRPLGREKGKNRFTKCTQAQEGNAAWASRRLRDAEYEEASGLEENHEIPE